MKIIKDIEKWYVSYPEEGCGINDYCIKAEMRIIDDDGVEKNVQFNNEQFNKIGSLSVSLLSLHDYSIDEKYCWNSDNCEEIFVDECIDIDDPDSIVSLLQYAEHSRYYPFYCKLVDSILSDKDTVN